MGCVEYDLCGFVVGDGEEFVVGCYGDVGGVGFDFYEEVWK